MTARTKQIVAAIRNTRLIPIARLLLLVITHSSNSVTGTPRARASRLSTSRDGFFFLPPSAFTLSHERVTPPMYLLDSEASRRTGRTRSLPGEDSLVHAVDNDHVAAGAVEPQWKHLLVCW